MKKATFICVLLASSFIAAKSHAQASATALASAEIVAPISITQSVDLSFGSIARSNVPSWVQLSPSGTRTTIGGATLVGQAGTVTAAAFTVAGEANFTYAITLPSSITLTNTVGTGGETVTVQNFLSLPTVGTGGTLGGNGEETLQVGAELAINANQVTGNYVSGTPFTVTVNYN